MELRGDMNTRVILAATIYLICWVAGYIVILNEIVNYNKNIGIGILLISIAYITSKMEFRED